MNIDSALHEDLLGIIAIPLLDQFLLKVVSRSFLVTTNPGCSSQELKANAVAPCHDLLVSNPQASVFFILPLTKDIWFYVITIRKNA